MNNDDYIVKDSSIWQDDGSFALENSKDTELKIGIVRDTIEINGPDVAYIVEVWLGGKYTPIQCTRSSRFGGVYNYEEFTYRGMEPDESSASDGLFDYKKGDCVLVAYLYGDAREGIIINGINHPGRKRIYDTEDDIVFQSEFNGLNKQITKDGEYRVTFKGLQTNIGDLSTPSDGSPIPLPEYDTAIGSSYYEFDKTGSYLLTDNAEEDAQSLFIDKEKGQIVITSGKTVLTIDKAKESYSITNKLTVFKSTDEFSVDTKKAFIKGSQLISMRAADIKTKGEWKQSGNMEVTGNITQTGNTDVTGTFSTSGATNLAGGANPLIYDIVLIKGTGNKGAPVISTATVLKTSLTKAT